MFEEHYKLTFFVVIVCACVLVPAFFIAYFLEAKFDIAPWGKIITFAIAFPVIQTILVLKLKKYLNKISNDDK